MYVLDKISCWNPTHFLESREYSIHPFHLLRRGTITGERIRSIDNNLLARYVVTPFAEAVNIGEKGGSWSSVLYQKVLIIPPTSLINTNTKHFNLSIFLNASYVQN